MQHRLLLRVSLDAIPLLDSLVPPPRTCGLRVAALARDHLSHVRISLLGPGWSFDALAGRTGARRERASQV